MYDISFFGGGRGLYKFREFILLYIFMLMIIANSITYEVGRRERNRLQLIKYVNV